MHGKEWIISIIFLKELENIISIIKTISLLINNVKMNENKLIVLKPMHGKNFLH